MEKICENCKWVIKVKDYFGRYDGECHYYPPRALTNETCDYIYRGFPCILLNDYCSKFEAKEDAKSNRKDS